MITRRRLWMMLAETAIASAVVSLVAARSETSARVPDAESNCVTTGTPPPTATYTYRTRQGGTVSTFTYRWSEYSDKSSRLEITPLQPAQGRNRVVTTTKYAFQDDLVVVDSYETTGTNAAGPFTTKTVHRPALVSGPALRVCQGKTWRTGPVQVTTTTAGRTSTDPMTITGEVVSIHEPVTVEAGSFDTVHFRQTQSSGTATVVVNVWRAIKDGAPVRTETTTHGITIVETLISTIDRAH